MRCGSYPHEIRKTHEVAFCAAIAVTPIYRNTDNPLMGFWEPKDNVPSGTVTFLKCGGRHFALTCSHVVDSCRTRNAEAGEQRYNLRTLVSRSRVVVDRFVQPNCEFGQPRPDVAIREVKPDYVHALGKLAFDLDSAYSPPAGLQHAIAVGFPTNMKYQQPGPSRTYRIAMPHAVVVAELSGGTPKERFHLFSELDTPLKDRSFSGMSGGPIFWSTDRRYGIRRFRISCG